MKPTQEELQLGASLHALFSGSDAFWKTVVLRMGKTYGRDFVVGAMQELVAARGRLQKDGVSPLRFSCPAECRDDAKPSRKDKTAWATFSEKRKHWRSNIMVRATMWLQARKSRLLPPVDVFETSSPATPGVFKVEMPESKSSVEPGIHRMEF